jgi:hypothetical protein
MTIVKRIGPNPRPLTRAEALGAELAGDLKREAAAHADVLEAISSGLTRPPGKELRIGASIPIALIRQAFDTSGQAKAITVGRECFIEGTITDDQIIAVAERRATLRGFNDTGITYHNQKCEACRGQGWVARSMQNPMAARPVIDCQTCKGDGFAPPNRGDGP